MLLKSKFDTINTMWARYSEYEVFIKNDTKFIRPTKASAVDIYNHDEVATEFLVDAINCGKEIYEAPEECEKHILDFISKYGTLGWMTYLPADPYFYHQEIVYLGKNRIYFKDQLSLPTLDYVKFFETSLPSAKTEGMVTFAESLGKDSAFDFVFSKIYEEPLLWTADKLKMIYIHFVAALNYDNENMEQRDKDYLLRKTLELENHGIYFHLTVDPSPKMQWEVDSLLTMLELIHATALSDEDRPLKACKHCGQAYYNKNARSEFCSVRCRNHFNVLAYRKRQEEKESE